MDCFVLEIKVKLIKEELFIEKNCGFILENIEFLIIEYIDIVYLFNREDLVGMKGIIGRWDWVEYFLKLCDGLLIEKREIVCGYLEGIVFLFKEKLIYNEELCK